MSNITPTITLTGEILPVGPRGPQGEKGEKGSSFAVLGTFDTLDELIAAFPVGNEGDVYAITRGTETLGYIWDINKDTWESIGPIAIKGDKGDNGDSYFSEDGDNISTPKNILPTTTDMYTIGSEDLEYKEIHTKDVILNKNSLQETLNSKADLVDGKIPLGQLPDSENNQWDEPNEFTLSTDKTVLLPDLGRNDQRVGSVYTDIIDVGQMQINAQGIIPKTTGTVDLGRPSYFLGNGYFEYMLRGGSISAANSLTVNGKNVEEYLDNVSESISAINEGILPNKADLEDGKVVPEQLPTLLELGETDVTAGRGDWTKTAYDHSQSIGNPHNTEINNISGLNTRLQAIEEEISNIDENLDTPLHILYVNNYSEYPLPDNTRIGTELRPFKTIADAMALATSGGNYVIQIGAGTYTEDIDIGDKTNITIRGEKAGTGHWATEIIGDINIGEGSTHTGVLDLLIEGSMNITSTGNVYITNCNMDKLITTVSGSSGYTRMDECFFETEVVIGGIASHTVDMFGCQFESSCTCVMNGANLMLHNCNNVEITSHTAGFLVSRGDTNFVAKSGGSGFCITSTADATTTNAIFLYGGFTFNGQTGYFPISKTGTCGWALANFIREPSQDTTSGTRIDAGPHAEDSYFHYTPVNYTKVDNSDILANHLKGIDNAMGIKSGVWMGEHNGYVGTGDSTNIAWNNIMNTTPIDITYDNTTGSILMTNNTQQTVTVTISVNTSVYLDSAYTQFGGKLSIEEYNSGENIRNVDSYADISEDVPATSQSVTTALSIPASSNGRFVVVYSRNTSTPDTPATAVGTFISTSTLMINVLV